ncbi:MAG: hypothetical protein HFH11_10810 [Dorea sp.]|jgi:hypothetical protein|nr:hypothetical protein [Dorea sp.]
MKRKPVNYSYEHGDETLPHLKDLVSDIPDPMKEKILEYLRTHCILACSGMIKDEINPDKTIGYGNLYSDGTYFWNDVFCNYVDRYNIPAPETFRNHILENYNQRMKRHTTLRLIDRVEIHNNPYLGYEYNVSIEKSGLIRYQNNTDCKDGAVLRIKAEDAQFIINPIMTELFCYDADEHGMATIDGYHWKLKFYRKGELIDEIEGWPSEDKWRYGRLKEILEFAERYIPKDLGSEQMNFYKDIEE